MSEWIKVEDGLPKERGKSYQVLAAQVKENGGNYKGTHKRIFVQDWAVRCWPENFVAWCYDPVGHVFVNTDIDRYVYICEEGSVWEYVDHDEDLIWLDKKGSDDQIQITHDMLDNFIKEEK